MKELTPISYCLDQNLPSWWGRAVSSPAMERLKDVGMNCGLEYTKFDKFTGICGYSRYTHSLGVAKIVWRFSHDARQTLAGLYHDIATPCFAHVIDFMRGDYLNQESTEEKTRSIIEMDEEIQSLLKDLNLTVDDVFDYHRYPIADTPSPSLSADRIEYTFSNSLNLLKENRAKLESVYSHLILGKSGRLEFDDIESARFFGEASLRCGCIYCCDEDRYSMEILSRLLSSAIKQSVLTEEDLEGCEKPLIRKLESSPLSCEWLKYREMSSLATSPSQLSDRWLKIDAKKRFIDPVVNGVPLSALDADFALRVREFLEMKFDCYMKASNQ